MKYYLEICIGTPPPPKKKKERKEEEKRRNTFNTTADVPAGIQTKHLLNINIKKHYYHTNMSYTIHKCSLGTCQQLLGSQYNG